MISKKHVITACIAAGVSIMAAYWVQPHILYIPRQYDEGEVKIAERFLTRRGLNIDVLQFAISSFNQHAYLITPSSTREGDIQLIIFFGGNAMTALDWCDWVSEIRDYLPSRHDTAFLLIDYPGYGANQGNPSPDSIQQATDKAVQRAIIHLRSRQLHVTNLNVLGHSIGAAVASRWVASLAESEGDLPALRALVLSAPFTSVIDMVPVVFPFIPIGMARYLTRHNWDNTEALRKIANDDLAKQIYIVHGHQDEIVPFHMGQRLAQVGEKIKLIPVKNAFHNDLLDNLRIYGMILGSAPSGKL